MKTVSAGQFKARCLKIMDEVCATRQPVVITKKGRPIAKFVPPDGQPKDIFGCMNGKIKIVGDIVSPITPLEDWEMLP